MVFIYTVYDLLIDDLNVNNRISMERNNLHFTGKVVVEGLTDLSHTNQTNNDKKGYLLCGIPDDSTVQTNCGLSNATT